MIYTVVAMKDVFKDTFEKEIMLFHNQEEAYASLRRNMRNLVIGEEVNKDTLAETEFYSVGEFDSETGKFDNFEQPICMMVIPMVADLLDEEDEDA